MAWEVIEMNRGIEKRLRALVGTGTWLEIHSDADDTEKFALGSLVAADDRWILLEGYDEDGGDDGYALRRIEDIVLVVDDSRYIRKVRALRGARGWSGQRIEPGDFEPLPCLLDFAMKSGACVSVEIMNSGLSNASGRIRGYDADAVEIEQIDLYGAADGIVYVPVDALTRIECGGADERRVARLIALQP